MTDPAAPDIDPTALLGVLDLEFSELYDIVQIECPPGYHRVSALEHLKRAREAARLAVLQPAVEVAEMCLLCGARGAVNFACKCGATDAHAPVETSTHDANAEPLVDDENPFA